MTAENTVMPQSKKSDKSDKSDPSGDLLTAAPAAPVVFAPGQSVRHANGALHTIAIVHAAGIQLEGVANLVSPADLTPA